MQYTNVKRWSNWVISISAYKNLACARQSVFAFRDDLVVLAALVFQAGQAAQAHLSSLADRVFQGVHLVPFGQGVQGFLVFLVCQGVLVSRLFLVCLEALVVPGFLVGQDVLACLFEGEAAQIRFFHFRNTYLL